MLPPKIIDNFLDKFNDYDLRLVII